jgi:hypothetical protein
VDRQFDAVLCTEVLEHVEVPEILLDKMTNDDVLKQGGTLFLTVPMVSWAHMEPNHYCTGFSQHWIKSRLYAVGMARFELACNGDWWAHLVQELRRAPWVAREYGAGMGIAAKAAFWLMSKLAHRFSGDGSWEFGNNGWLVKAVKR